VALRVKPVRHAALVPPERMQPAISQHRRPNHLEPYRRTWIGAARGYV